jgi:hypothetical protein
MRGGVRLISAEVLMPGLPAFGLYRLQRRFQMNRRFIWYTLFFLCLSGTIQGAKRLKITNLLR